MRARTRSFPVIHVEDLHIRGSDTAVEWILVLDRYDFHVQFFDLLKRKFHASHVRGSGLSLRVRLRLEENQATPEIVAALPPVPGFSDPPYKLIGPPPPPLTDADYNLWSVQLDDVDAEHVRELWIQSSSLLRGPARAGTLALSTRTVARGRSRQR